MTGRWEKTIIQDSLDFNNNHEQPPPTSFGAQQNTNNNVFVLVTKLKKGTSKKDIYTTFKQFGEIEDFKHLDARREAIVQFTYSEGAAAALQEETVECGGKMVFVHPYGGNEVPASIPASSDPSPSYEHYSTTIDHHASSRHLHSRPATTVHHGSPDYVHTTAPRQQFRPSPQPQPPSSNHYHPEYHSSVPPRNNSYSEEQYVYHSVKPSHIRQHESHQAPHYHHSSSPKGNQKQHPSGNVSYCQPQQEVNYSSENFQPYASSGTSVSSSNGDGSSGGDSGNSGGGGIYSKSTAQKMDGVRSAKVEEQRYIDLCFMFDGTGSMGPHLVLTLKSIKDIISEVQKEMPTKIIRLAYVVYRDYPQTTTAPVVEHLNFTQDVDRFMNSLSKVQAVDGGDECEDVVSGLVKVQELEWSSNTRILVWIADAPCHGRRFHDGLRDTYAKAPPKERPAYSEKELLERLRLLSIRNFFFLKINNTTDKMVNLFKEMFDSQGFELKQEAINANKAGFVDQIVGSVMYSVNFQQQQTQSMNVMVVESQQGSLRELVEIIKALGYNCVTTTYALGLFKQYHSLIHCIFVEVDLITMCSIFAIRSYVQEHNLHPVFIVGVGRSSPLVRCEVDNYISKPFSQQQIISFLQISSKINSF